MTSDCEINMFVSESENKLRSEQKKSLASQDMQVSSVWQNSTLPSGNKAGAIRPIRHRT